MGIENLKEYCEANQGADIGSKSTRDDLVSHQRLVRSIALNPSSIDLRDIVTTYTEVALIEDGTEIGCVDAVFISRWGDVYICEAKASRKSQGNEKQLQTAYDYIKRNFGILPVRISIKKPASERLKARKVLPDITGLITQTRL